MVVDQKMVSSKKIKHQIRIRLRLSNYRSSYEPKKLGQNSFYGQNDLFWPWLSTMVVDQKMVKINLFFKKNVKFEFIFVWRIQGALMSLKSSVQTRFMVKMTYFDHGWRPWLLTKKWSKQKEKNSDHLFRTQRDQTNSESSHEPENVGWNSFYCLFDIW